MEKPFQAYTGADSYVFVCYAHEDSQIVYPELLWLREQGVNLWYDEGISAGKNWRAVIGDSLLEASYVLFYISARSLESAHCNREINLALDEGKNVVPVYLEDVELTSDMKVGLNRVQALHRNEGRDYQQHLLNALGPLTATDAPGTASTQAHSATPRRYTRMIVAAAAVLVVILGLGYQYRDTLLFSLALNAPSWYFGAAIEQELGFVVTPDGTRIAYATSGEGPPIVQVQISSTHLENGQGSPMFDNDGLVAMSSRDHQFVRYDGRGFGLSDRDVTDFSLPALMSDLEAVVNSLGLERFSLFAVSSSGPVAIAYAAQHPERVTHLVLAGVMASYDWKEDEELEGFVQLINLVEIEWDRNPYVSNMLASMLLDPAGDEFDRLLLGEMLRRSGTGSDYANFSRSLLQIDSRELAKQIRVPTLVIQARHDAMVGMEAARRLAALVPDVKLEIVEGGHMASSGSSPDGRRRMLDFVEMAP